MRERRRRLRKGYRDDRIRSSHKGLKSRSENDRKKKSDRFFLFCEEHTTLRFLLIPLIFLDLAVPSSPPFVSHGWGTIQRKMKVVIYLVALGSAALLLNWRFLCHSYPASHHDSRIIRQYRGPLLFSGSKKSTSKRLRKHAASFPTYITIENCERWVVHLGIPDDETLRILKDKWQQEWCTVIVEDTPKVKDEIDYQTVNDGAGSRIVYLSIREQERIQHPFVRRAIRSLDNSSHGSRWSRKNIGYLFAMRHGAKIILDLDTTYHILRSDAMPFGSFLNRTIPPPAQSRVLLRYVQQSNIGTSELPLFNPLPYMMANNDTVRLSTDYGSVNLASIGLIQHVSGGGSSETEGYDFLMKASTGMRHTSRLLPPRKLLIATKTKSGLYTQAVFGTMFLPSTMSDIDTAELARSYLSQIVISDMNLLTIIDAPLLKLRQLPSPGLTIDQEVSSEKQKSLVRYFADVKEAWERESNDFIERPQPRLSPSLSARMEQIVVGLYEHGFIELDDVQGLQEWLQALEDLDVASSSTQVDRVNNTPMVVREPTLQGQPYRASPAFNVGRNGRRYADYLAKIKREGSYELFEEWKKELKTSRRSDNKTILKIVSMSKNEWPLIRDWTLYHGKLVGFENLYIVDGSTDPQSISFLAQARDHLGVNVIFTSAGLNQFERILGQLGSQISKASDFILKADPDEFLVAYDEDPSCSTQRDSNKQTVQQDDCTLSPLGVRSQIERLKDAATGERLKIGYRMVSMANQDICADTESRNDVALFPLASLESVDTFKTISDARTLSGIDTGGHKNYFAAPFGSTKKVGTRTDLAILHFHTRCLDIEVSNCRKVLVSHNYIDDADSEADAKSKLLARFNLQENQMCSLSYLDGHSGHKALFYLKYLHGCITAVTFYNDSSGATRNPDFENFLNRARQLHANLAP